MVDDLTIPVLTADPVTDVESELRQQLLLTKVDNRAHLGATVVTLAGDVRPGLLRD